MSGLLPTQSAPALLHACKSYLATYRQEVISHLDTRQIEDGDDVDGAARYTKALDGLLSSLFCCADALVRRVHPQPPGRVALVGVGSYGRGRVAYHSDVDIVFLTDTERHEHVVQLSEAVLYPLWDLGLHVGHAVRSVDETLSLARQDMFTTTTLLDIRRVAGSDALVRDLRSLGHRHVIEPHRSEFVGKLKQALQERHEKFGGSLYLLEPEVKLGRGGLRDIDVAMWAAKARWGLYSTDELLRAGALTPSEYRTLQAAQHMLWRVRNHLHVRAGRRQDRLTFEDQEEIAGHFGFHDGTTLAVEQFMQQYYRHAESVAHLTERIIERCLHERHTKPSPTQQPLGGGVAIFDQQITVENAELLEREPAIALRLYQQVARHHLAPHAHARELISRLARTTDHEAELDGIDASWPARLADIEEAHKLFLQLLLHSAKEPVRRESVVAELHETGLLLAMIPEFGPVTGRVQHDVYHIYTVDVHSVTAVQRLHQLIRGDLAEQFPLACQLAAEVPHRIPLVLGLLLHDIGKAHGREHAEKGAEIARVVATRMGLGASDIEHVVWLVRAHLRLYHWATRRDLSDPETLQEITQDIQTLDRLRDLYLLTVADLSTTNPNAMTSWKQRMLDDLYLTVASTLEQGSIDDFRQHKSARAEAVRAEVRALLGSDRDRAEIRQFLLDMPDRYHLANTAVSIVDHAHMASDFAREGKPVRVAIRQGVSPDVWELVVQADDRPRLLADIAAALSAQKMAVVAAQVYTRSNDTRSSPQAFDVFHIRREGRYAEAIPPGTLQKLEENLEALRSPGADPEQLVARPAAAPAWSKRHTPAVRTRVQVHNHLSSRYSVVDVYTKDSLGLLYTITRALYDQGLSIAIAKVNTEGDSVADVFYVQPADGSGKLLSPEKASELVQLLQRRLEERTL